MINPSTPREAFELIPLDLCYEICGSLTIDEAFKFSKAFPRTFGAVIESTQTIRFRNAINSAPLPLFFRVLAETEVKYSSFRSWLKPRLLKSCIVPPRKLIPQLSSIIAFKDRGFSSVSSTLNDWDVSLKAKDEGVCSISWRLLYRASLFGFDAREFHQACGGVGKFVVVVQAENGRVAVGYNEYGFNSDNSVSQNLNGFIVSIEEDGSCGARFDRTTGGIGIINPRFYGILNDPGQGPSFNRDLVVSNNCHENKRSFSILGDSYGSGDEVSESALFGEKFFRVCDYEVFKIVIE
jgi:hypothetical protein